MRPHTAALDGTFLEFDLPTELAQLERERAETGAMQMARTLARYPSLRVVLIALGEGGRIAEHQTAGRITIQTMTGHIRTQADGRVFDMPAGRVLALDESVRHDLEALVDSAVVLTLAWPVDVIAPHVTE
jgi:quercetin dioxygenase-like cupin family protein